MIVDKKFRKIYEFLLAETHNRTLSQDEVLDLIKRAEWLAGTSVYQFLDPYKILGVSREELDARSS